MLEGARLGAGCFVGELRADEFEVLEVQQRRASLGDELCVPRQRQQSQTRDRRDDDDQRRGGQDASCQSHEVAQEVDRPRGTSLAQQHCGEQEPRDGQEDVDAAGDPSGAEHVEQDDARDGESAQTVQLRPAPTFRMRRSGRSVGASAARMLIQVMSRHCQQDI